MRSLLLLCTLLFSLQIIGAGIHKHALAERAQECTSCVFSQHVPTPVAALPLLVPPSLLFIALLLPKRLFARASFFSAYLTPPAQAPPLLSPSV